MEKSGIYQIVNRMNNRRYIGSTSYLRRRLTEHLRYLRHGTHANKHLQSSFITHGEDSFIFEVIEICAVEQLLLREQYYIDMYQSSELYNFSRNAASPATGYRHTPTAIAKIGLASRGKRRKPMSVETKFLISIARAGTAPWNKGIKTGLPSWNSGTAGVCKPNRTSFPKRNYDLLSPEGERFTGIGIGGFAREKGLRARGIQQVLSGEKKSHRGWRQYVSAVDYRPAA